VGAAGEEDPRVERADVAERGRGARERDHEPPEGEHERGEEPGAAEVHRRRGGF
jgi:hypothetical protein